VATAVTSAPDLYTRYLSEPANNYGCLAHKDVCKDLGDEA